MLKLLMQSCDTHGLFPGTQLLAEIVLKFLHMESLCQNSNLTLDLLACLPISLFGIIGLSATLYIYLDHSMNLSP
jgi:hypothetical protein